MEKGLRQSFAQFILKTHYEDLPEDVIDQAKRCTLDFLGVALAGSKIGLAPMIADILCSVRGKEEASIIGKGRKIPALHAVLVNAVRGHTLDMDDCHRYASGHPGIVTIPAALAMGERENASWKDFIEAVVVGYEVFLSVASAINPTHLGRGFHTTGTVGPFAAAAACSKLLKLNEEEVGNALAISGLQGAGLLEVAASGQMIKPLQPGRAAQGGVLACLLAKEGAQGPDLIFEGEKGFFKAFSQVSDMTNVIIGPVDKFEIMSTAFKLYAVCRVIHPSADAVLEICNKEGLGVENIEAIEIATFPYAIKLCGGIVHPDSPFAAKFSIPCCIAMAILFGGISVDKFTDESIHNKDVKALASKVKLSVDEQWASSFPEKKGATVTIRTHSGRFYSSSVPLPKGEPENPATLEELMEKFFANSSQVLSADKSRKLGEHIMGIEKLKVHHLAGLFY
jgi:2-methylcitrate dehydratase PrpD